MEKDPAILWYPKDFLAETTFLSMEERGLLVTLRANFFIHGRLPLAKLNTLAQTIPSSVLELLEKDANGLYYCPVVELRQQQRKQFKDKQSEKGKLGQRVKKLKNEKGITTEEARKELEKEGHKFGKSSIIDDSKSKGGLKGSLKGGLNNNTNGNGNAIENENTFKDQNGKFKKEQKKISSMELPFNNSEGSKADLITSKAVRKVKFDCNLCKSKEGEPCSLKTGPCPFPSTLTTA